LTCGNRQPTTFISSLHLSALTSTPCIPNAGNGPCQSGSLLAWSLLKLALW
jgi:hypothetical protein